MNVKYVRKSVSLALAVIAVLVTAIIFAMPSYAESLSPGLYSVKVVPVYNNPDTGKAEDVGQNPGIGQMMVEAQVQNAGYIEVYEDGSMYLNTRWNLAEPTIYAGFATSSDGSKTWQQRQFDVTRQVEAGNYEFAGNNFDAVVTDFRLPIGSANDTIRCTNWVDAMARECIWYCYLTDIRPGVDDTWNIVKKPNMADYTNNLSDSKSEETEEKTVSNKDEEKEEETPEKEEDKKENKDEKKKDKEKKKKKDKEAGIVGLDKPEKKKTNKGLIAGIVIVCVLVVGGLTWYFLKYKKEKKPEVMKPEDKNEKK